MLWPGLVRDFAQTSGTTAGDKYIPVSREMLRSKYWAALDIFANLSRLGVSIPGLMSGKCLFLGGSTDLSTNEHGIRTGDLSALVGLGLLALVFLPHLVQDDGRVVRWWMRDVKRTEPSAQPGVTVVVDQTLHIVVLFLLAVLIAVIT